MYKIYEKFLNTFQKVIFFPSVMLYSYRCLFPLLRQTKEKRKGAKTVKKYRSASPFYLIGALSDNVNSLFNLKAVFVLDASKTVSQYTYI